jgi:hypothetical protein
MAATVLVAEPALSGCASLANRAPRPDPLESPARRAEADAVLAQAVGQAMAQTHPELAGAARALAADRTAHATALRAELLRVRPGMAAGATPQPVSSPPAVPPAALASPVEARAALSQAVRAAQGEATTLVISSGLPGYRAALLGSVAACCASHGVLLR